MHLISRPFRARPRASCWPCTDPALRLSANSYLPRNVLSPQIIGVRAHARGQVHPRPTPALFCDPRGIDCPAALHCAAFPERTREAISKGEGVRV